MFMVTGENGSHLLDKGLYVDLLRQPINLPVCRHLPKVSKAAAEARAFKARFEPFVNFRANKDIKHRRDQNQLAIID